MSGALVKQLKLLVYLLGQGTTSHVVESDVIPGHAAPPYCAEGLLHNRERGFVPGPQVREQAPHPLHPPQLPFTVYIYIYIYIYINMYNIELLQSLLQ